jgi:hypothetical protein
MTRALRSPPVEATESHEKYQAVGTKLNATGKAATSHLIAAKGRKSIESELAVFMVPLRSFEEN